MLESVNGRNQPGRTERRELAHGDAHVARGKVARDIAVRPLGAPAENHIELTDESSHQR